MIYEFPLFPISDSIRCEESERSPAADALVYQDDNTKGKENGKCWAQLRLFLLVEISALLLPDS